MRRVMPKRSMWRVMQFNTLRLRLITLAARVIELKTQIKIHLPSSAPDPAIFAMLDRLGYGGWVGCEYRPRGRTEDGLSWARPYGVFPKSGSVDGTP